MRKLIIGNLLFCIAALAISMYTTSCEHAPATSYVCLAGARHVNRCSWWARRDVAQQAVRETTHSDD